MFSAIHHVSLSVSDLDRSLNFYEELGFVKETVRYEVTNDYFRKIIGYPNAIIHTALMSCKETIRLELMHYIRPEGIRLDLSTPNVGSTHICFVVEDIFSEYRLLVEKGVKFKSDIVPIDAGPNKGGYAVYFLDPDGYTMELLQCP